VGVQEGLVSSCRQRDKRGARKQFASLHIVNKFSGGWRPNRQIRSRQSYRPNKRDPDEGKSLKSGQLPVGFIAHDESAAILHRTACRP
jgi:hypothetical protein